MSVSVSPTLTSAPAQQNLLYFEHDHAVRPLLRDVHRFRQMSIEHLDQDVTQGEWVVVCSSDQLLSQHYNLVRQINVRVIAIRDERFEDPRIDGVVYSYLPARTPAPLLERAVVNALDHIHLKATRHEVNERLAHATREIHELNQIGAALSAEHDTEKLLEMILTKSRQITLSDAGSLYLVEQIAQAPAAAEKEQATPAEPIDPAARAPIATAQEPGQAEPRKQLRFKLAQNDSISVPFREVTMELNQRSIAGYVALSGEPVNIEDAYHLPEGVPFTFGGRKFDEDSGYRTRSILAVPMRNQKGEVLGVVQLINAKRALHAKLSSLAVVNEQVVPYTQRQQELALSMASQAAVALENSQLYAEIQAMLEGFVRASVIAIEARDPTTSGHSFRVSNLTVALAEAVDRVDSGLYSDLHFTRNQMKEIRYAALLHDFGKVGVREEVLVKAQKLYPAQLDLIRQRFEFVKQAARASQSQRKLAYVLEKGREEYLAAQPQIDADFAQDIKELDDYLNVVLQSNEPTVLPAGQFEHLLSIASTFFDDFDGKQRPLLSMDEVRLLSIRKGSLDEKERLQIESHVVHTFNFLKQIPWTKEIRSIPQIARGHHEKLNGQGYPFKLSAPQIPVQTRMMTISDVFDALGASDRPYKKAVPQDKALDILGFMVKDGEVDPNLFGIFKEAKVWDKWKVEPFPY